MIVGIHTWFQREYDMVGRAVCNKLSWVTSNRRYYVFMVEEGLKIKNPRIASGEH